MTPFSKAESPKTKTLKSMLTAIMNTWISTFQIVITMGNSKVVSQSGKAGVLCVGAWNASPAQISFVILGILLILLWFPFPQVLSKRIELDSP